MSHVNPGHAVLLIGNRDGYVAAASIMRCKRMTDHDLGKRREQDVCELKDDAHESHNTGRGDCERLAV